MNVIKLVVGPAEAHSELVPIISNAPSSALLTAEIKQDSCHEVFKLDYLASYKSNSEVNRSDGITPLEVDEGFDVLGQIMVKAPKQERSHSYTARLLVRDASRDKSLQTTTFVLNVLVAKISIEAPEPFDIRQNSLIPFTNRDSIPRGTRCNCSI
jgi:hypothetical protein